MGILMYCSEAVDIFFEEFPGKKGML